MFLSSWLAALSQWRRPAFRKRAPVRFGVYRTHTQAECLEGRALLSANVGADAFGPYWVYEQSATYVSGYAWSDSGAAITAMEWDFNYDGVTFDVDATGAQAIFAAAGIDGPTERTVAFRATEENGASAIDTATVNVVNAAPTIEQLAMTSNIVAGETAALTGTFQDLSPSGGHTVVIDWDDPNDPVNSTFTLPDTAGLQVGQQIVSSSDASVLEITDVSLATGMVSFQTTHPYLDSGLGVAERRSIVDVTVTDDDGAHDSTVISQATPRFLAPNAMLTFSPTPTSLTIGNRLYFTNQFDPAHGPELMTTDGTAAGTELFDIVPGPAGSSPMYFVSMGGKAYFLASTPDTGQELWTSDGTLAGTHLVTEIVAGPANGAAFLIAAEHLLYITAMTPSGFQLWKSDGTAAGTALLSETLVPAPTIAHLKGYHAVIGDTLFFMPMGSPLGVAKTDGTVAGTELLTTATVAYPGLVIVENKLFFIASQPGVGSYELWTSDGTVAGTQAVTNFSAEGGNVVSSTLPASTEGAMYFAVQSASGMQLWTSDGTTAGTQALTNFVPGEETLMAQLMSAGNNVYFNVMTPTGFQLWKTDGTVEGTLAVVNGLMMFPPGSFNSYPAIGNTLFFVAMDMTNPGYPLLWKSDGTPAGTERLVQPGTMMMMSPGSMVLVGDTLLFAAAEPGTGMKLWSSDGTAAGTHPLTEAASGSGGGIFWGMLAGDEVLYFSASGPYPYQAAVPGLWRLGVPHPVVTVVDTVAPEVTPPANQTAAEGTATSIALGSFSAPDGATWTVTVDWGDTTSSTFQVTASGSLGALNHTYPDNGNYSVNVTVAGTGGVGDSGSASFQVAVTNVAPTATADTYTVPQGTTVTGNVITDHAGGGIDSDPAGANDPLTVIAHTNPTNGTLVLNTNGSFTYVPETTFAGVVSFSYTISDGDGGTSTATVTINVTAAAAGSIITVNDTCLGGTALLITGTAANDTIVVEPGATSTTFKVTFNGVATTHQKPSGRIIVTGGAGNDNIQIAGAITNPAWLYGDAGNDRLNAGNGGSLLIGGDGNDQLLGGNGRDIQIGGEGADSLVGNSNDDILVAGYTTKDLRHSAQHEEFWCQVSSEWNSNRSFDDRVGNLRLSLKPQVIDDVFADSIDFLNGSSGNDWLIFMVGEDKVAGKVEQSN